MWTFIILHSVLLNDKLNIAYFLFAGALKSKDNL